MRYYRHRSDPVSLFAAAAVLIGLALVIEAIIKLVVVVGAVALAGGAVYVVRRALIAPAQPLLRSAYSHAADSTPTFAGRIVAAMRSLKH